MTRFMGGITRRECARTPSSGLCVGALWIGRWRLAVPSTSRCRQMDGCSGARSAPPRRRCRCSTDSDKFPSCGYPLVRASEVAGTARGPSLTGGALLAVACRQHPAPRLHRAFCPCQERTSARLEGPAHAVDPVIAAPAGAPAAVVATIVAAVGDSSSAAGYVSAVWFTVQIRTRSSP